MWQINGILLYYYYTCTHCVPAVIKTTVSTTFSHNFHVTFRKVDFLETLVFLLASCFKRLFYSFSCEEGDLPKMAKASTLAENLEKELECAVCLEQFKDPKVLPCLHSFCKICLEGLVGRKGSVWELNCPSCRISVEVSSRIWCVDLPFLTVVMWNKIKWRRWVISRHLYKTLRIYAH